MGQQREAAPGSAQALCEASENMGPKAALEVVARARSTWLQNVEVVDLLRHHKEYNFHVNTEPPTRPPGGSLFLFDRKTVRYFRKDGHNWRKKADGKTVRETHEKLKVGKKEMLNCYYSHAEHTDALQGGGQLQRRCYWLLEGDDDVVLVHYLMVDLHQNRPRPAAAGPGQQQMQVAVGKARPLSLPAGVEALPTPSDWANMGIGALSAGYRLPGSEGLTQVAGRGTSSPKAGAKRPWHAGDPLGPGAGGTEFADRLADIVGTSWAVPNPEFPRASDAEPGMFHGNPLTDMSVFNRMMNTVQNGSGKRTKMEEGEGSEGGNASGAVVPTSSPGAIGNGALPPIDAATGQPVPGGDVQQMVSRLVSSVKAMTGAPDISDQQAMSIALGIASIGNGTWPAMNRGPPG